LQGLVNVHGWHNISGDAWLQKLDILKASTKNTLGAVSLLAGLQENLGTSQLVNNMCNRLISDVTGVSAQSDRALGLLVLLNASLSVYDEGDLPVAQNRLVFAVKQILSWVDVVSNSTRLASEMFRALHRLLPAIKGVYGSYWESSLAFCITTWESNDSDNLTDEKIPVIGMSLKLYTILRCLEDANDDLEDSLRQLGYQISNGLVHLLQLRRSKDSLPQTYTDDLLARETTKIPLDHVKNNLSEIYPLVASDYRMVQSAAFDILHRALPEAQQQLSIDVILEKRGKPSAGG
jgi:E3 ubiquitin-protein ligase listerin